MGILEIAVAALSVMGGTTVGSAITGAIMGSRREIGAFRGFLWGLLLPVVGMRALKKGFIFISLRIVYLKSFSNFYKLVQIFDSQRVIIKKTGHIALISHFYCPGFGLFSQDLTQISLRHSAS